MAPEKKTQKRKAAIPDDEISKVKKVKAMAAEVLPKKRKASSGKLEEVKQSKATKSSTTDSPKSALKKKSTKPIITEAILEEKPRSSKQVAKVAKELKALKQKQEAIDSESEDDSAIEEDEVNEKESGSENEETSKDDPDAVEIVDDQTRALLAGFESSDEDEVVPATEDPDRKAGEPLPTLDKKTKKKMRKLQEAAAAHAASEEPGVIYLGRIPHGFYENEMKQYFKQFGDINHIRMSRNPKTGASKHYAFIEFESSDVAEIVAKTMDNYLMFGHILKCKMVPKESVHEQLFKDANRRFKKVPWNKIQGRALTAPAGESVWEKKNAIEEKRRQEKRNKLRSAGIEYDFDAPALRSAKGISSRVEAVEAPADTLMIEAPLVETEAEASEVVTEVTETIVKKGGKTKKKVVAAKIVDGDTVTATISTTEAVPVVDEEAIKTKKGGKTKKKRA